MGASVQPEDPMLRLQYYRETGQADEAKQYEEYLRSTGQMPAADPNAALHASYKSGRLAKNVADKNAAEYMSPLRTNLGGAVDAILGAPETVAAGFPGGALAMSLGRKVFDSRPLPEIQQDINERTSDIPYASAIGRGAGALAAFGRGPLATMSAAKGGAALMGVDQLLNNDPGSTLGGRVLRGGAGYVGGGLLGKGAELLSTLGRVAFAPTLGKTAAKLRGVMSGADESLYGAAKAEGDKAGTTPQIQAALNLPGIKPYADEVRNSLTFAGANDAEVLRETYKLMSERAQGAGRSIANADNFKAGTTLEKSDLKMLQRALRDAGQTAMPTFPVAVAEHSRNAGVLDAFSTGADAARRELSNSSVAGVKQVKLSPEAVRTKLAKMTPEQAATFTEGVLGRTVERMTPGANPINLFGIPRAAQALYRAGPLLRAADQAAGTNWPIWTERGLLSLIAGQ